MSDAQSSSEPLAHTAANLAPAQTDVGADAALILAALSRLEAAVRDGREVLGRLRACLSDMANAIVKAKAMADSPTAISLLNEFEHRIDTMIEIAGVNEGRQPPHVEPQAIEATAVPEHDEPAAAEPDEVPTVSNVVSKLGGGREPSSAVDTPEAADRPGADASNVAMLTAMVQALRDSMPPAAGEPTTTVEAVSPAPQAVAPAPPVIDTPPPDNGAAVASTTAAEPEPNPESTAAPEPTNSPPARLTMAAALPQPEFVSMPVERVAASPQTAPPAHADPGQPAPPVHDPLRALKAMSENERLALFS